MNIYPTYTSGDWVKDTVIIGGIREYYAGSHKRMSQLARIPPHHLLDGLTRIKPDENTLHV